MNIDLLLKTLEERDVTVAVDGDALVVKAAKGSVTTDLQHSLRENKSRLIEHILANGANSVGGARRGAAVPTNLIAPGTVHITPAMLPLIELSQSDIDRIVADVPGGVANVQDIYALAPLQEGILFHHMIASEGDPYLSTASMAFATRTLLDDYLSAVQSVVDRHDILRTGFVWKGLTTPAQVVLRTARLTVTELSLRAGEGDILDQLEACFDPRQHRIDLGKPPLLSFVIAHDPANDRWLLLQRLHHLIGDHSTLHIMHTEAQAYLADRGHLLGPPRPFRELVARARHGISMTEHEAFFCHTLGEIDAPTLPFGLSDVHREGHHVREAGCVLPETLNVRMHAQSRRLGVSVASMCHLAWGLVISRTSERSDIVMGTVLFGRMQAGSGVETAMGLFINTLPLRLSLSDMDVETSVRQTHEALANLLAHEHASLALAQRCSGVAAPAPLFGALINYRHNTTPVATDDDAAAVDTGVRWLRGEERTNYPLILSVEDFGHGIGLTAQIVAPFEPERICSYMQQALDSLVDALERAPATAIGTLAVVPPAERYLLLETFNSSAMPYPYTVCVQHLFEEQVANHPDTTAVIDDHRTLTYAALNAWANRLAHALRARGVQGGMVGIVMERGIELVVAQLAVLKAGAAYVPIDPHLPEISQTWILDDTEAEWVLVDAAHGAHADVHARAFDIAELDADEWPSHDPDTACGQDAEAIAYVMYTSGSTGLPKGVLVPHRAINRLVRNNGYAAFGPDSRVAFAANPAFDAATLEVWAPLLNGGVLVIIDPPTLLSTPAFIDTLRRTAVNTLWLTVALFNQLADALAPILPQLGTLIVGGDALDPAVIARVLEGPRPQRLLNGYGPTETTTFATTYTIEGHAREANSIPIGRPISNARLYVLDAHRQPVPLGAVGELYIGGDGVALGYLKRPELTAERFLSDPFDARPDARMYRTGDLARYLPDGNLVFMGRVDDQVKIRGYRIEPGEIEARLAEHPAVREVAVLVRQDPTGDKRLVAYVVVSEDAPADLAAALREHLAPRLPDYMIPAAYIGMDAFPLTPNGKLDRKALPAPDGTAFARQGYEAPHSDVETILAGIWQELLGIERVGRYDHFFELGGHSLLAVRLLSRIAQVFGVDLPLTAIFANATLAELAATLPKRTVWEQMHSAAQIVATPRNGLLPLSFAQKRLWFLAQLEGVSVTYHIPLGLRLRGTLDIVALRRTVERLFDRHESLRTVFTAVDGEPGAILLPMGSGVPWHDIDLADRHDTKAEMRRIAENEAAKPFDLAGDPPIRACLLRMAHDDHVLLLIQHHIVSDGWSMGVLLKELSMLYRAFTRGDTDPLPALTIQYPDYAAWQMRSHANGHLSEQADYWRGQLANIPTLLSLPTDRPRPLHQDFSGAIVPVHIDPALARDLRRLALRHGSTVFMTVMAAWAIVLGRLSGQTDLVIGTPTANRGRHEVESLIGFFVNTLTMRVELTTDPDLAELLERVRKTALDAQANQDLPFEQVVDIVNPPRRLDHTPLFQVLFAWQSNERVPLDLPGLQVEDATPIFEHAKYDLELYLGEDNDDGFAGVLNYATALFDHTTVERYRDYLVRVLAAMVADPTQTVGHIDLLSDAERSQLLETFNDAAAPYPRDVSVHALFEEQARQRPDAVALVDGDSSLTYAQLNTHAHRIAHRLTAAGVAPGDFVATLLERSAELVITQLAILKMGAAYVPIDPQLPEARQAWLVQDADARVVIAASVHAASALGTPVLGIDELLRDDSRVDHPLRPIEAGAVAYVMYTSGSTGLPKGVLVPHRAINRLVRNNGYAAFGPDSRVAFAANPAFDAATLEVWAPLLNGGVLVIIDPPTLLSTPAFIDTLRRTAVNTLWLTVALFNQLADALAPILPQLGTLIVGGDALDPAVIARVLEGPRPQRLLNGYGPTETTTFATTYTIEGHAREANSIPIGRPISNARLYVLDAHRQPVPLGAVGELYIGGDGVALGYLKRPELTAERFLSDPFDARPDARMYRTGDLARYLPDGNLVFMGRVDDQVKIRGYRIEPGEIEARLAEHPAVREVAVLVRQDPTGDKRLVAYVVVGADAPGDLAAALREHLAPRLPDYMIPAAYIGIAAFPLTPNGKLDRKALPDPEYSVRAYRAPVSAEEIALTRIFAELFEHKHIGVDGNFFELGGHSLLAMRLVGRIRTVFGVDLPVSALFEAATIASLAERLSHSQPSTRKPIRPMRSS